MECKSKMFVITNEEIKRLTEDALIKLGAEHYGGIDILAGIPKRWKKGYKRTYMSDDEIHYAKDSIRYEIVKTADVYGEIWACRRFDLVLNRYKCDMDETNSAYEFIKLKDY